MCADDSELSTDEQLKSKMRQVYPGNICHEHTLIELFRAITRYVQNLQIWDVAVKISTTNKGVLVFVYPLGVQCTYVALKYISTNM